MASVVPWRVRTFGGFCVERSGVKIDRFRTRHAAALLAYLALRPDVRHPRESLAELLWPDADPLAARQRLSAALATLRRELESEGGQVFVGGRDSVGVARGTLTSDAAEFNRLLKQAKVASRERRRDLQREALELAERGEFLPGFYFDWTVDQASAFEEALDSLRLELSEGTRPSPRPAQDPSSLIGRGDEIERLDDLLLAGHRCVSILGAGGVGKTRLALDLFERHARRFVGAKVFVRLAEVRRPADFLPAVARTLQLPVEAGDALESAIAGALAAPSLVVLDNLEHLLPAVHPVLDRLLRTCGNCAFVCTSRRRLRVAGEQAMRVAPLQVADENANPEELEASPAIRLFVSRVREAGGPQLSGANLADVREICQALGGLPLAIQLAASAAVSVGLDALREGKILYRILPERDPDATNPHASLHATIDWSLSLLNPAERRALDFLCIVPGPISLKIVTALHSVEAGAALPKLHSDSLLEADGTGAMRVLEPIRERVAERMNGTDRAELEARLVRRCAEIAGDLETRLEGRDQRTAYAEAIELLPTMRRAAQLAHEHGLPNEGLSIVTGFSRVFWITMAGADAIGLAEPLLKLHGVVPGVRARACVSLTKHHRSLGHVDASIRLAEEGLALASKVGDEQTEARGWASRAFEAYIQEDQAQALSLGERALRIAERVGDAESLARTHLAMAHAHALYVRDASSEDVFRARALTERHMEAAIAAAREAGDDLTEAGIHYNRSEYAGSDLDLFRARLTSAIALFRKNGWNLYEAKARMALVRRLYAAGLGGDVLSELRSLQQTFAEHGRWEARAEMIGIEAEVLFRMDRLEAAADLIAEALDVLRHQRRPVVVEHHVQALIHAASGSAATDDPLLALLQQADESEFNFMMGTLARALLEARRGEDIEAFRRLQTFKAESAPIRIRHAYADTLVALGDLVIVRNLSLAVAAFRRARPIYREIKSSVDLARVRKRVSRLRATL